MSTNKEYQKRYREENKERLRVAAREYYRNNKEKILERDKAYREANKTLLAERRKRYIAGNPEKVKTQGKRSYNARRAKILQQKKEYYKKNRQAILRRSREYYELNKDVVVERQEKYRTANPEVFRIRNNRRRAQMRNVPNNFTQSDWNEIKRKYKHTCPACGCREPEIKLTIDHIIPISKRGHHTKENIQPLCSGCNNRKQTRIAKWSTNGQLLMIEQAIESRKGGET